MSVETEAARNHRRAVALIEDATKALNAILFNDSLGRDDFSPEHLETSLVVMTDLIRLRNKLVA